MCSHLNQVTLKFDTVADKDAVVDALAKVYADYRRTGLLAQEISRRYRRMMRMLHPDNLDRVLGEEQKEAVTRFRPLLTDLATMAACCRRFLSSRRALNQEMSELMAVSMDFELEIRRLRSVYVRRLVNLESDD